MVEQVKAYVEQQNIALTGKKLVLAVSGGADSVCLFDIFCRLQIDMNLKLVCVHVNHGLRETAGRDEEFVRNMAEEKGIPFYVLHADVKKAAAERKCSEEEAGRMIRYEFFRQIATQEGAMYILTAHHRDDCAETVLFHLFRGSSLRGLGGIRPVKGQCLRPLLCVSRAEIEAYLEMRGLSFVTDETNALETYTRNRIRHRILPEAEQIVSNASEHIVQTATELQEIEDYLREETNRAYQTYVEEAEKGVLLRNALYEELSPLLCKRVIYEAITFCSGSAKDVGRIHVRDVVALFQKPCGKSVQLPYEVNAVRHAEGVVLNRESASQDKEKEEDLAIPAQPDTVCTLGDGITMCSETIRNADLENIPQKRYTKWFDYDTINCYPIFRKRREGDYLVIDAKGRKKSLKRYFIDEKIPASVRDDIWLLADGNHVMWVLGYRISEACKVTKETKRIVQWHMAEIEK